jgi:hypothetical protein
MPEKILSKQKQLSISTYRRKIRKYLISKGLVAWGYLDAHISLPNEYMMCALFPTEVVFFRWKNIKESYTVEMKYEDITEEILDCCLNRYLFEVKHRKQQKELNNIQGDFND